MRRVLLACALGCGRLAPDADADAGDDAVADVAPETCPVDLPMMQPPLRENACSAEQLAQLAACGAWPWARAPSTTNGARVLRPRAARSMLRPSRPGIMTIGEAAAR
jgi:hypothetical protein